MKYKIPYLVLLIGLTLGISGCIDQETVEYTVENDLQRNDPLTQVLVNTPTISFVAGEPGYDIDFLVITPNNDETSQVNVYKVFTDATTQSTSEEVLFVTYDVAAGQNTISITDNFTYAELKADLMVDGNPLPDDEVALAVGSKWDLRLEPVNSAGQATFSAPGISIAVLSPFAGLYEVIDSDYWRIGVQSGAADWTGNEVFIGSVDATTFSHVDNWGPFTASDGAVGQFLFTLNDDNTITVIDDPSQLFFSGNDMLTCQEDGPTFANVPCAGSNVLEPSSDGKHIIKLTYGYFTNNSGPREFYEVLQKIVE
ncbi:MAG: hypothetical protein AAFW73_09945 [Bacteroidota bacterium]